MNEVEKMKFDALQATVDKLIQDVRLLNVMTGLACGDPHEHADIAACIATADAEREQFNKDNPENPL
jgi:hypothetical protein